MELIHERTYVIRMGYCRREFVRVPRLNGDSNCNLDPEHDRHRY